MIRSGRIELSLSLSTLGKPKANVLDSGGQLVTASRRLACQAEENRSEGELNRLLSTFPTSSCHSRTIVSQNLKIIQTKSNY